MKFKSLKYIVVATLMLSAMGCDMEEDPKFPAGDNLFTTVDGANTVLNGCYSELANFNYYGADFFHLTCFSSGLFTSNKDADLTDIISFNTTPSITYVENVWKSAYRVIARANNVIENLPKHELADAAEQDNILGQAYFLRGLTYFNLVRIYGGVPLHINTATVDHLNLPRSSSSEVYDLVVTDLTNAVALLKDVTTQSIDRPAAAAANMLLAKVHMTLAGNQTAVETMHWQLAYDQAIMAYGKYLLLPVYNDLWMESTGNNSAESIFEIQGNEENTLRLYQLFTPSNGNIGLSVWGRIKPNVECYDMHAKRYPNDPRIGSTFLSEWVKYDDKGKTTDIKSYPLFTKRNNKDKSYPWLYKFYIKDGSKANYNTIKNFTLLRYADLLLMLAEIENELNGPDNAYQYVNQVLARARASSQLASTQPADWSGMTQDQFRTSIMMEYRFELLGETHEWFNDRRRGYAYFKTNVVDVHNNNPIYDFTVNRDVKLPDNERNMLMPIPQTELTSNPLISQSDQNPGY